MMVDPGLQPSSCIAGFLRLQAHFLDVSIAVAEVLAAKLVSPTEHLSVCRPLFHPGAVVFEHRFAAHDDPVFLSRIMNAGTIVAMTWRLTKHRMLYRKITIAGPSLEPGAIDHESLPR